MSIVDTLGIKRIYSNPYYHRGNSIIENVHNFLKRTIAKFMHGSQPEWDDALPLVTYCYNIAHSVDDLESPFYSGHGRDPLEGRLSNPSKLLQICQRPTWPISSTRVEENVEPLCKATHRK